jgi:hypothetical protein
MWLRGPAREAWIAYHDEVERDLAPGGELAGVRDSAAKAADNAARLAALWALAQRCGLFVTDHAARQFCERIAPGLRLDEARRAIAAELRDHGRTPRASHSGAGIIVRARGGRYAFRAVITPGAGGPLPEVVTVHASGA